MYDHVICSNCDEESLVPVGTDVCIKCGFEGGLAWANEARPERTGDDLDEDHFERLQSGLFWRESQLNAWKYADLPSPFHVGRR